MGAGEGRDPSAGWRSREGPGPRRRRERCGASADGGCAVGWGGGSSFSRRGPGLSGEILGPGGGGAHPGERGGDSAPFQPGGRPRPCCPGAGGGSVASAGPARSPAPPPTPGARATGPWEAAPTPVTPCARPRCSRSAPGPLCAPRPASAGHRARRSGRSPAGEPGGRSSSGGAQSRGRKMAAAAGRGAPR